MKAAPKFLSTVSAIAMATAPALGLQFASVTVAEAAVVRSISVSGNQRVADATIADFVGFRAGKDYSAADVDEAIKALFRTGLFSDVSVSTSGGQLIVVVSEYSTVNQVLFQGNRKLKDDRLNAVVRLQPRGRFDQETLNADVDAITEAYSRIGRSDVTVNASVVDLGENRVNVVYEISEGDKTRIAQINFTGNNAFSDRRLQSVISTKRSNFMSWLSRNDVYDEQRLAADEEQLRRFYFNRGYADFRVISSSADTDPNSGDIVINIEVDEGERYSFGAVDIDSTVTGVDPDSLARTVQTRSGATYSAKDVEDTLIAMSEKLAANGFPFAEVTPVGNRNFETNTIDVSYIVDQGQRAYIERIEISGNTATRDYVIRREFDVAEGDAFNQILIRRAQKRLEALDFFERVNISTRPGSSPDRVIVVVEAIDKPTGEFGAGVGYTTGGENEGLNLEASIIQRNFQGRGQALKLAVGGGAKTRTYSVSFTEPYFLGYRLSATFNAFQNRNSSDYGYDAKTTGGSISFGLPITDNLTGNFGYGYTTTDYTRTSGSANPNPNTNVEALIGTKYVKSAVNYGLTYNTIDDQQDPHEGIYARFNQEVAGLGGDARFIKSTVDARYYYTLVEDADVVGMLRAGGGYVAGLGRPLAYNDYFKLGPNVIRGFAYNGIGPQDTFGARTGGKGYVNFTAEAQFPIPGISRDLGFKGAVFADAATLFGSDIAGATGTAAAWRASAGVSFIWQSPFAPLRFDYAWPVKQQPGDKIQKFNFSVSTAF